MDRSRLDFFIAIAVRENYKLRQQQIVLANDGMGPFPGSILGAIIVPHMSAQTFGWIFAVFLVAIASDMIFNAKMRVGERADPHARDSALTSWPLRCFRWSPAACAAARSVHAFCYA
jgi:uncharacterized membrane protein YfcA